MSTVSVIISTYNDAGDVGEALTSVLNQTARSRIREILVVDDGSTDDTSDIVRRYERKYDRVLYIFQENQGPGAARNRGIRRARGDCIAFLDADDLWLPQKLEKQFDFMKDHRDVGLVCTDFQILELDGTRRRAWSHHFDHQRTDNLERLFAYGGPIIVPSVVVRSACFEKVGLFNPDLPKGQDTDMWLRIAAEYPIHHLAEPLVVRRRRPESVSSDPEEKARYLHTVAEAAVSRNPELRSLAHLRAARVERALGLQLLKAGRRRDGLRHIIRAIKEHPADLRSNLLLVAGLMPVRQQMMERMLRWGQSAKSTLRSYLSQWTG